MKTIHTSETFDIPAGVTVEIKARIVKVTGPRGTLTRNFKHLNLDFQVGHSLPLRRLRLTGSPREGLASRGCCVCHGVSRQRVAQV